MLQFIVATAEAFCFGKHTSYSEVRRQEPTWPGRPGSQAAVTPTRVWQTARCAAWTCHLTF